MIHCYQLYNKTVIEIRTLQLPFIIPYCLVSLDKFIYLAGIDREFKGDKRVISCNRNIYRLPLSVSDEISTKQIKVQPDKVINVVKLSKEKGDFPISQLSLVNRDILVCACL